MKVGISGSRTIKDRSFIEKHLLNFLDECSNMPTCFITGKAYGVDLISTEILENLGWDVINLEPIHKLIKIKYTPSLFYARDMQVVDACDVLLCFWDGKSTGTNFTRKYAMRTRKRVEVYKYE